MIESTGKIRNERNMEENTNNCSQSSSSNVTGSQLFGSSFNITTPSANHSSPCNITDDGHKPSKQLPCYTCDISCTYKCVEMILFIGILANFLVVFRVIRDRSLRKPTFVTIACLALSDGIFLTTNMGYALEMVIRQLTCNMVPKQMFTFQRPLPKNIVLATWCCANVHITFMAVIRYMMLVHPIKCSIYLTNKRVVIYSAIIWIVILSAFFLKYALHEWFIQERAKSVEYTSVIWICVYLLPLVVTSLLHINKLLKLHRHQRTASIHGSFNNGKQSVRRMAKIVTVLVLMAAILPLPRFIYEVLVKLKYDFPSLTVKLHYQSIAFLIFFLNNTLNPFVYAFLSVHFRRSMKSMCTTMIRCDNVEHDACSTELNSPQTTRRTIPAITHGNDTEYHKEGLNGEEKYRPVQENDFLSIKDTIHEETVIKECI